MADGDDPGSRARVRTARLAAAAWRALPGDLLARVAGAASGSPRETRRVALLDAAGRAVVEASIVEDPRLARFLDAIPVRPTAMTLGRHVFARGSAHRHRVDRPLRDGGPAAARRRG